MGAVDQGPAAARLLRQRAARCDGGGLARSVRTVFRDHGRPGLCVGRRRRELEGDRPRSAGGAVGGSADTVEVRCDVIRVILPAHLKTLARVTGEVTLDLTGAA